MRMERGTSAQNGSGKRGKGGYIVVETLGSFTLFFLLMISILSLINIVAVQARVHYALTEAAQTVSMYSYVLEVTGAADSLMEIADKSGKVTAEVNQFKSSLNSLLSQLDGFRVPSDLDDMDDWFGRVNGVYDDGNSMWNQGKGVVDNVKSDPRGALQTMLSYGFDEGLNEILEHTLLRPLVNRYLKNGNLSGSAFLQSFKVIGDLNFHTFDLLKVSAVGDTNSHVLNGKGNVKLVAQYDIDYTFGALPLPFDHKLHVTQEVLTKAWLNGLGDGYTG